jgi:hypothetical protein
MSADKLAQAARAVIDALHDVPIHCYSKTANKAMCDLLAALAAHQAQQAEPVAEVYRAHHGGRSRNIGFDDVRPLHGATLPPPETKLYAAPQQAQAPGWISVNDRLPKFGRVVPVTMYAGRVNNDAHPGYPGKPWVEHSKLLSTQSRLFMCEATQTGRVTHWLDVEPAPQQGDKT